MEPVLWNRLHFLYRSGKIVRMNTSIDISHIRNFSIVAHIDHGKSTISDRILELTHTVDERDMESQLLDTMDIERERGITIKSNAVRVSYDADDGETYQFNLIDTPGHVDFTYEVSRSLAACEGAVLVVDATQGVEAQTVSNATLAMNANLDIVPAINKIDLPSAHPDEVKTEIEDDLAIPADDAVCVSGKTGEGIHDLLESIVFLISPPKGDANAPLKALILDSYFDEYRGVVATVRIFDGSIKKGDTLRMMQAKGDFLVDGVGVKRPAETPVDALTVGEVGYVVTGLKDPEAVRVGDTLTWASNPCPEPLPGYREAKPMVYTGLFPIDNKDYENLRDALDKLHVNDPSLVWEPETSVALGFGFRVGFLGLLLGSSGAGFLLFLLGGAVAVNIGLLHTVKAAGAAGVIGGKLLCTTAGSFVLILIQRTACFHSTPGVHRARRVTSMVDIARRIAGVYPADLAHNVPPFYSNDGNWSFILFGYGTPAKGSACPFIGCRPRGHHPVRQRYRGPVGCLFRAQRQCFVPVHGTAPGPGSAFPRHAAPPHRGNPVRHWSYPPCK